MSGSPEFRSRKVISRWKSQQFGRCHPIPSQFSPLIPSTPPSNLVFVCLHTCSAFFFLIPSYYLLLTLAEMLIDPFSEKENASVRKQM